MAKRITSKPDWLKADQVDDILSVSGCVSEDFADWINYWKHNGYWFFDSPDVIVEIAKENGLDLASTRWFYYEAHDKQHDADAGSWEDFAPKESFTTEIVPPRDRELVGFDIVTFSCGSSAECSPLSCNHLAEHIRTNRHCLLDSLDAAVRLMNDNAFLGSEPGPFRIFAVYEIPAPITKRTTRCHTVLRQ